nr:hypothetical protein [Tanacetum cinerariifolium]
MSQLSETTCVPKDNWKKRTASESMDEKLTKRQKRNRAEAPKILAETLAKWTEYNKEEKAIKRKTPAKGSKKGCMKGKGGPENSKCSFRGSTVQAALAYDEAARAMHGPSARLNLPNYSENTSNLDWFTPAESVYEESEVVNESLVTRKEKNVDDVKDVTGYCNEDGLCQRFPEYDMFDLDELLSVMDQKSEYDNENKPDFSKNTLSKAAAAYDSAATCSYSETTARAMYGPSARLNLPNYSENISDDVKDVTGYCNEDGLCQGFPKYDMCDLDELLSVMDQKSEYNNENKLDSSENTLSKAVATYDSVATCSYSEASEVQDLKSGLPAQCVYEENELLSVMDQKAECNNENKMDFNEIESVYVQQDPYGVLPDFDFDFVEAGGPEECSFSLE